VDPIEQGLIVMDVGSMQLGSTDLVETSSRWRCMHSWHSANAYQVGLATAGAAFDMVMLYLVCKGIRVRSCPAIATQQRARPDSMQVPRGLANMMGRAVLPARSLALVTTLVAFICMGCASWGVRLSGASRRRKRRSHTKKPWDEKFVPRTYQDEPDVEPSGRSWWWTSIFEDDGLSRTASSLSGSSISNSIDAQSRLPIVPLKSLVRQHKVKSTDDEPEDEDSAGIEWGAIPGSPGFVGQQTAEVERVLQISRMHTEGQVHLVDEEGLEQRRRESEVVPDGIVLACTGKIERQVHKDSVAFAALRMARNVAKG